VEFSPFLAVDLGVLRANIERAQRWADARGLLLRPHAKTHKCVEIARLQTDAGASGLTVATIGEAEVFADAGFADLFIAYPLWPSDAGRARLARVASRAAVQIGVDSLEAASGWAGVGVRALIEVDSGHHRSGVLPEAAGELAAAVEASGLKVDGVFTFPGHSYAPGEGRARAGADEASALATAAEALRAAGVEPRVVSGGSTPSLAGTGSGLTESRPGVYVFNDAQQWELGSCATEDVALTCHATVVSHAGGRLVLDAGSKVLGADRAAWASGFGRLLDHPDARLVILSEHHAVAELTGPLPPLGSTVRVVPNHACNAVNLVDELVVFEAGRRVAAWAVAARGRND
jgi:D-serine deaminase-like pyridoxal phosphate-dependent protein